MFYYLDQSGDENQMLNVVIYFLHYVQCCRALIHFETSMKWNPD